MNKVINIFIDHAGNNNTSDGIFAQRLMDRLKSIKQTFNITAYKELNSKSFDGFEETSLEIKKADIIIPIISAEYLAFAPSFEILFNDIIDSNNKYLFPILYRASSWSSYRWIVKSKLIPEDIIPLSEHSENDVDRILNELVSKISAIIVKNDEANQINSSVSVKERGQDNFVFISHDHEDGDFAELLKLQLEKEGINGWIDNERLKIGQDWRQEIDDGISNALAVIAIMTPDARKSEYVTYEWAFAWGKGKKIFPIMLKQTQLHPRLESLQYLDFTKRNSRPFDNLIKSLKSLI
jgi:hypothetical protein